MENKTISRLILKEDDVLVLRLPVQYFNHRNAIQSLYRQVKEKLLEAKKNNKIIVIPNDVEISVIGDKEIKEYVSNFDLWHLWEDTEE